MASIRYRVVISLLFCLLSIGRAVSTEIRDIASVGSRHATLLDSIEFRIETDSYYEYHYFQEGEKFRVEAFRIKAFDGAKARINRPDSLSIQSSTVYESVYTFDGREYFRASRKGREIIRHGSTVSGNKYAHLGVSLNPLLLPYSWIMEMQDDYGWSVICNERAWGEALKGTAILDDEKISGLDCVQLARETEQYTTRLWLAKRYGFFPLRLECRDKETGECVCERKVLQYRIFDAGGSSEEKILVPLKVIHVQSGRETTSTIREDTLIVNKGIDDDLFTLTPSHNTIAYVDVDEEKERLAAKDGSPVNSTAEEERGSGHRGFLIAGGAILALLATIGFLVRKGKKVEPDC